MKTTAPIHSQRQANATAASSTDAGIKWISQAASPSSIASSEKAPIKSTTTIPRIRALHFTKALADAFIVSPFGQQPHFSVRCKRTNLL